MIWKIKIKLSIVPVRLRQRKLFENYLHSFNDLFPSVEIMGIFVCDSVLYQNNIYYC